MGRPGDGGAGDPSTYALDLEANLLSTTTQFGDTLRVSGGMSIGWVTPESIQ